MRALRSLCERAKCDLSALVKAEVDVGPIIYEDLTLILSRAKFDELCRDQLHSTIEIVKSVLSTAQVGVLLFYASGAGGSASY